MGTGVDLTQETATFGQDSRQWLGSAHGTQATQTITLDGTAFMTLFPDGNVPSGVALSVNAAGLATPAAGAAESTSLASTATAGTFTLTVDGEVTAAIAFNATAAAILAALEATSAVKPGDLTATGGALPGAPVVLTRTTPGDAPNITVNGAGLTAANSMTATVTAGTGAAAAAGHLYSGVKVATGRRVGGALYERGRVRTQFLPAGAGAARAPHIIYVDR